MLWEVVEDMERRCWFGGRAMGGSFEEHVSRQKSPASEAITYPGACHEENRLAPLIRRL